MVSVVPRTRPAYPPEFRREAVELLRAGRSPRESRPIAAGRGETTGERPVRVLRSRRRRGKQLARISLIPQNREFFRLLERSDVLVENFRVGVMDGVGLSYETLHERNPRLVYGAVTGYGNAKQWRDRPGQDLLAQARSGIMWLSGDHGDPPTPMARAIGARVLPIGRRPAMKPRQSRRRSAGSPRSSRPWRGACRRGAGRAGPRSAPAAARP